MFLLLAALGAFVLRKAAARHRATPHLHGTPDLWPPVVRNASPTPAARRAPRRTRATTGAQKTTGAPRSAKRTSAESAESAE